MFIHLHAHSQFSLLDATPSVNSLVQKAVQYEMPALALTDHGNMYGAIDFYKACKEAKIKSIIGCELNLAPGSRFEKKKSHLPTSFHIVLLAKNKIGYHNLIKLSSLGFLEGFYYESRVDFELLERFHEGLICLSGCLESPFAWEILHGKNVEREIEKFHTLFGEDFYLEIQRHKMAQEDIQLDAISEESWLLQQYEDYIEKQNRVNDTLCELSTIHNIPLVATNDIHFLDRQDWKAHEVFINIQSGEPCEVWQETAEGVRLGKIPNPKRLTYPSHELYFKSPEEMKALFHDLPKAIENSLEIAQKCDVKLDFSAKHYPVYTPPTLIKKCTKEEHKKAVAAYLEQLCHEALGHRYTPERLKKVAEKYPGQDPMDVVKKRLSYELEIISSKDMCDYLLIVWDFIHWAKNQKIPMGPGRGSGAGSIICYLIGITDIEPLRFNLLFERFINPERLSYPDIDVDICMERRQEVINYTIEKYGKDNVAQIITFGSMKAKMVIRDVGRTLSIPLAKVNTIAKLIPEELNITIDEALQKDAELKSFYDSDPDCKKIIDIGKKLEGSLRSTGLHAAGLIIAEKPLMEYIPICHAKDSDMLATQYSMKPVEMVGMLKIDFLGLKTLTSLQICQDAIKKRAIDIDWTNLPLDDKATFDLLNGGKTQGIFQLESGGMQELAKNLHLDKFEEVIAVVALYRPGPMEMIPSFVARKNRREPIEYDHPWLSDILSETYGIMVYQEQVMQIASKLANYSFGEGDVLRRAMGKKDHKEMSKQREKFTAGCLNNQISQETATRIFDRMEKFAEYGFNKSHAAAYGYLSYATAFMKTHYPTEWLAALMTSDRDDISKLAKFTQEGKEVGVAILPPSVNESENNFIATAQGIRFALSGIKGVGSGVVEAICQERASKGPFTSLYNFVKRIDAKRIGKKSVELLIDAGCFDFTLWHRDQAKACLDAMFDQVLKQRRDSNLGVMSLFAELDSDDDLFSKPPTLANLSSKEELLFREKALLGFFLSGHPLDIYRPICEKLGCTPLAQIEQSDDSSLFRTAFLIDEVIARISSKTQKKFVILIITDPSGARLELPIWPELYDETHHLLVENKLLAAIVTKEKRNDQSQLSCKWVYDLKSIDENVEKQCDAIFDRSRFLLSKPQNFNRSSSEGPKNKTRQENSPKILQKQKKAFLCLDIEKVRHSHILKLKTLLEKSPSGSHTVEVKFIGGEKEVASISLIGTTLIDPTPAMEKELKQISSFSSIIFE